MASLVLAQGHEVETHNEELEDYGCCGATEETGFLQSDIEEVLSAVRRGAGNLAAYITLLLVLDAYVLVMVLLQLLALCLNNSWMESMLFQGEVSARPMKITLISILFLTFLSDYVLAWMLRGLLTHKAEEDEEWVKKCQWSSLFKWAEINMYVNIVSVPVWLVVKLSVMPSRSWPVLGVYCMLAVYRLAKLRPLCLLRSAAEDLQKRQKETQLWNPKDDRKALEKFASKTTSVNNVGHEALFRNCAVCCTTVVAVMALATVLFVVLAPDHTDSVTFVPRDPGDRQLMYQVAREYHGWVSSNGHGYYCADHDCGTGQIGRSPTAKRIKAAAAGTAACLAAGAACAGATIVEMAPLALAAASACCSLAGGTAGGAMYYEQASEDSCIPQCSDEVPVVVQEQLWCVPRGHNPMCLKGTKGQVEECQGAIQEERCP